LLLVHLLLAENILVILMALFTKLSSFGFDSPPARTTRRFFCCLHWNLDYSAHIWATSECYL